MSVPTTVPMVTNVPPSSTSLAERMDTAIGEASSVMGALMTELIRRSLRGGVLQIGEGLHEYVCEQVDTTLVEKSPVLEQIASDTADRTARSAATEVAREETEELARRVRESDQQLAVQIEQTAATAQRVASEVARDLSTQIGEAEKRACETARGELDHRIDELKQKSRETIAAVNDRLRVLKSNTAELGQRFLEEQQERRAGESKIRQESTEKVAQVRQELTERGAALAQELLEERTTRLDTEKQLRQELLQTFKEANTRLRAEIDELRNANVALRTRVEELEKPRGLRALLLRLMFWRKR
jgi:hypothetical protein